MRLQGMARAHREALRLTTMLLPDNLMACDERLCATDDGLGRKGLHDIFSKESLSRAVSHLRPQDLLQFVHRDLHDTVLPKELSRDGFRAPTGNRLSRECVRYTPSSTLMSPNSCNNEVPSFAPASGYMATTMRPTAGRKGHHPGCLFSGSTRYHEV